MKIVAALIRTLSCDINLNYVMGDCSTKQLTVDIILSINVSAKISSVAMALQSTSVIGLVLIADGVLH